MYLCGSALWILSYKALPATPSQNLERVWNLVSDFYRRFAVPCQFSNLTLNSFTDPHQPKKDYPKLKGRGGEVKHLVPALLYAWEECMHSEIPEHGLVRDVLRAQVRIQELIDEDADMLFMEPAKSRELRTVVDRMLHLYCTLAAGADASGELLWNVVPKFHWAWHLAHRSQYVHPRRGACLLDEDWIGRIKDVAKSCTSSTPLHKVPHTLATKYHWGMYVRRLPRAASVP